MDRPITTLFMLMSLDGKISPGASDDLDVDKDFPKIEGLKEGLHQYYEIEQTTDLWSFNTGLICLVGQQPSDRAWRNLFLQEIQDICADHIECGASCL